MILATLYFSLSNYSNLILILKASWNSHALALKLHLCGIFRSIDLQIELLRLWSQNVVIEYLSKYRIRCVNFRQNVSVVGLTQIAVIEKCRYWEKKLVKFFMIKPSQSFFLPLLRSAVIDEETVYRKKKFFCLMSPN